MHSIFRLLSISLVSFGLGTSVALAQPGEPAEATAFARKVRAGTPEEQVKQDLTTFINYLNTSNDFFKIQSYISDARIGFFGGNLWFKSWTEQRATYPVVLNEISAVQVQNGTATAVVSLKLPDNKARLAAELLNPPTIILNELVNLKRGTLRWTGEPFWQIVPRKENPAKLTDEPDFLGNTVYILAQQNWNFSPEVRGKASLSGLKMLMLCAFQFTQDYDGNLAFAPEQTQEALMPYAKSSQPFQIPNTKETYTFNGYLSGKNLGEIPERAKTVMFYEGEGEQPVFRYGDKAAIGYADGHCKLLTREEAKELIWKPVPAVVQTEPRQVELP